MFLPGSTKVCGEVNVLEDNSQEEAEVFQVSLLAPERIEISRRTAKVTIQDTTSSNVLWGGGSPNLNFPHVTYGCLFLILCRYTSWI